MASPAAKSSRPRSEWKARPPMPTPHCCRNQRRLASLESFVVIALLFRNRLVEIQQHAGERRPGAALRGGVVLDAREVLHAARRPGQVLLLSGEEAEQHRLLLLGGEPGGAAAEGVNEALVVGRSALLQGLGPQRAGALDEQRLVQRRQGLQRRVGA